VWGFPVPCVVRAPFTKQTSEHLVRTIADAVGVLAGDSAQPPEHNRIAHAGRVRRRLVELAGEVEDSDALEGVALLRRVVTGNVRLLIGMVRANHPWRLVTSLSRASIGAIGVAAFAVVSSDVWRIAAQIDAARLAVLCVATICASVATLIVWHGLWERAADRRLREQAFCSTSSRSSLSPSACSRCMPRSPCSAWRPPP
jgi:hypothetical protein